MTNEEAIIQEVKKIESSKPEAIKDIPNDTLSEVKEKLAEQKRVNDELEAEYNRAEELRARKLLGGRAEAGQGQEETQEDKDQAEAERLVGIFR